MQINNLSSKNGDRAVLSEHMISLATSVKKRTSETISDSAERYAGLSVRFESSAACM